MSGDLETVAGDSESPDVVLETELEPFARAAKTQNLWVSHLPNSEFNILKSWKIRRKCWHAFL